MTITTPEEEKVIAKKKVAKKKVTKKVVAPKPRIPMGYTRVRLDSLGKLSAPFELHFRDYSIEEVLELANTSDDMDNLGVIVKVLNNMVFEDFDCAELVLDELLEVVYTLQGAFYSSEIERKVILDIDGDKNDQDNYVYAHISLGDIGTKQLEEEFKEPFTLTDSKTKQKFEFRLPRIKDKLLAEDYLREKYSKELRQFSDIYTKLKKIESNKNVDTRTTQMKELEEVSFDEIQGLRTYLSEKMKLMLILTQGLSLVSVDGRTLDYGNCEEILEIIPTISRRVWETFTVVAEKYSFGLQEDVTFFLPELGEDVTRRLAFQPMDFLPNNESEINTGVTISFE